MRLHYAAVLLTPLLRLSTVVAFSMVPGVVLSLEPLKTTVPKSILPIRYCLGNVGTRDVSQCSTITVLVQGETLLFKILLSNRSTLSFTVQPTEDIGSYQLLRVSPADQPQAPEAPARGSCLVDRNKLLCRGTLGSGEELTFLVITQGQLGPPGRFELNID
jgi:hypothetical protein